MDSVAKFVLLENLNFSFSDCFKSGLRQNRNVNPVVGRLLYLLAAHRIYEVQLLSIVPNEWDWNLETVYSPNAFIKAINHEVIQWFSNTFAIDKTWLATGSNEIYLPFWGYKNTKVLKQSLRSECWIKTGLRMSILAEDYTQKNGFRDRYMIVFSLPAIENQSGKAVTFKHRPFEWQWSYRHPPCYNDTVNVAHWIQTLNEAYSTVPIIPIKSDDFQRLVDHKALIAQFWTRSVGGLDHFKIDDDIDQTCHPQVVKN